MCVPRNQHDDDDVGGDYDDETVCVCACVKTWMSAECTTADVLSCVTIRKVHLAADVTTASSSNLIDETASVSIRQTSVC